MVEVKVRCRISPSSYILAKTDAHSSRVVSATAELLIILRAMLLPHLLARVLHCHQQCLIVEAHHQQVWSIAMTMTSECGSLLVADQMDIYITMKRQKLLVTAVTSIRCRENYKQTACTHKFSHKKINVASNHQGLQHSAEIHLEQLDNTFRLKN